MVPTNKTDPKPNDFDFRKRLRPRTYSIAIYVVSAFLVLQLIALASVFWLRHSVVVIEHEGPRRTTGPAIPVAAREKLQNLPLPQIPARLPLPEPGTPEAEVLRLNEEAREFRKKNDFSLAEAALTKARTINPKHPATIINLAMLAEAREDNATALKHWKELIQLNNLDTNSVRLARERAVVIEELIRQKQLAQERETQILNQPKKIQLESVLTKPAELPKKPAEIQFDFNLRAGEPGLDPMKMRIQIFVYDQLGNGDLVPAKIEARFLSARPKWSVDNTETLRVRYTRETSERNETRAYYGYLIRLLYDNKVQDERAEPPQLLTVFPFSPEQD